MPEERWDRAKVLASLPAEMMSRLEKIERLERECREIARDMFLAGYSWADVGRLLGVSRQAARQRFGAEVEHWRAEMGDVTPWEDWPNRDGDPFRDAVREMLG